MKIIGFSINKIASERKNQIKGKLEIKNNFSIENISKTEVNLLKEDALKIDFAYTLNYEPNFAEIKILGSVVCLDDKKESEAILKEWKNKKFISDSKIAIFNYIMEECNFRAINMEKDLGLPFHLPFPKISAQKVEQKKDSPNLASYTG
jgi:hypothetical protein